MLLGVQVPQRFALEALLFNFGSIGSITFQRYALEALLFNFGSITFQRCALEALLFNFGSIGSITFQRYALKALLFNVYLNDLFHFIECTNLCNSVVDTYFHACDTDLRDHI